MLKRRGESGNVFFTLFGAVALVGVVGVATSNLMRGPVGTVMKLNQLAKAESQLEIARKLTALEAAEQALNGDCDGDNYIEPLAPDTAGACGTLNGSPNNMGCLPSSVGASKTDPWGTSVGYCGWDHGPTIGDACATGLVSGTNASGQAVIAVVSAGPNRTFETDCDADPDYITPDGGGGDDIVMEWTYDDAVTGAGGLWELQSGNPDVADIGDRGIEVGRDATFESGASFASNVSLGSGSFLDLTQGSLFDLPNQVALPDAQCTVVNTGVLRINDSSGVVLQICDGANFIDIGGSGATGAAIGADGTIQLSSGGSLYGVSNFNYDYASDRLRIGASGAADDTLEVTGTADISGTLESEQVNVTSIGSASDVAYGLNAADLGIYGGANEVGIAVGGNEKLLVDTNSTDIADALNVGGNSDLGGTLFVSGGTTLDSTLDVSGATSITDTLNVTLGTTLQSTLSVAGDISDPDTEVRITDDISADNFFLDTGGTIGMFDDGSSGLELRTASTKRFQIDAAGDIGIALAGAPTTDLDIGGVIRLRQMGEVAGNNCAGLSGAVTYSSGDELLVCSSVTGNWETIGTSGGGGGGGGGKWSDGVAANDIHYSLGDVGVGTSDPQDALHVDDSGTSLRVGAIGILANTGADIDLTTATAFNLSTNDGTLAYGSGDFHVALSGGNGDLRLGSGNLILHGSEFVIDPAGTETAASGTLAVDVTGDLGAINFCNEDGNFCFTAQDVSTGSTGAPGNDREIIFNSGNSLATDTNFVFTSAGRLGIGTNAPSQTLDVTGTMNISGAATLGNTLTATGATTLSDTLSVVGDSTLGGLVRFSSTGATVLPLGTDGQRPSVPENGMIRYNTDDDRFEAYQAGLWQDIVTGAAVSTLAGLSDTNITGPSTGEILYFSGTEWINYTFLLDDLGDVDTAGVADGDLLYYSAGAGGWLVRSSSDSIGDDSLDWDKFTDGMILDATTTIDMTAGDLNFDANTFVIDSSANSIGIGTNAPDASSVLELNTSTQGFLPPRMNDPSVSIAAPATGLIAYNSTSDLLQFYDGAAWRDVGFGATLSAALDDLTDVNAPAPSNGNVLYFSGTEWINNTLVIDDLGDAVKDLTANNIFLGHEGGSIGANDINNTAFGINALDALNNSTATYNVGIGLSALTANTSGDNNTAVGGDSALVNTTGSSNTAIGASSFINGTTGDQNTVIGHLAAGNATAADGDMDNNTIIGFRAGYNLEGGAAGLGANNNTLMGFQAGDLITLGDNNLIIGYDLDPPTATTSNYINIGDVLYGSAGTGEFFIGGTGALALPSGAVATRPGDLAGTTAVNGMIRYNTTSDRFEAYQAGLWQDIITGSVVGGAANPDRGVQFNSGGNFAADAGFTYSSTGLLSVSGNTDVAGKMALGSNANIGAVSGSAAIFNAAMVIDEEFTDLSPNYVASLVNYQVLNPSAAPNTLINYGITNTVLTESSNSENMDTIYGEANLVVHEGTGTVTNFAAGSFGAQKDGNGDVTNLFGLDATSSLGSGTGNVSKSYGVRTTVGNLTAGDTVTDQYGVYIRGILSTGTVTNNYGLFIEDQAVGAVGATNSFALYSSGGTNFFAGQVGVGTNAPNASALVDISSTTQGFLPPRMDTTQRDAIGSPVQGLIVFNSAAGTNGILQFYDGTQWLDVGAGGASTSTLVGLSDTNISGPATGEVLYFSGTEWVNNTLALNDLSDVLNDFTTDFDGEADDDDDNLFIGHLAPTLTGDANPGARNLAIGVTAMTSITEGDGNIAIGYETAVSLTDGRENVAIGRQALRNTTSNENIAIGSLAGESSTGVFGGNVLIGHASGQSLNTGANVAIGTNALQRNVNVASSNVALGTNALRGALGSTAGANTAIGIETGELISSGSNNIFMGYQAGNLVTTGSNNIVVGYDVDPSSAVATNELNIGNVIYASGLYNNSAAQVGIGMTSASNLVASAMFQLESTTQGFLPPRMDTTQRDAIGSPATGLVLYNSSTNYLQYYNGSSWVNASAAGGLAINDLSDATTDYVTDFNMFMGDGAGANHPVGAQYNIAIGQNAFDAAGKTNAADANTAVGYNALTANLSGYNNTAIGSSSLQNMSAGSFNTAVGHGALRDHTSGDFNTALGSLSLASNDTGAQNAALGYAALLDNDTGSVNVAIGIQALSRNTTGSSNVGVGSGALLVNDTGSFNVAIGREVMGNAATAAGALNRNVAIGWRAGYAFEAGADNNILVGYSAGSTLTTGTDNIMLGYDAEPSGATASNELNIGNVIYASGLYGTSTKVGIGTSGVTLTEELEVYRGAGVDDPTIKITYAGVDQYTSGVLNLSRLDGAANRQSGQIIFSHNGTGFSSIIESWSDVTDNTGTDLRFLTDGPGFGPGSGIVERMRIDTNGGVSIGSDPSNADVSALLELTSTNRGFLPPRMDTTQRDAIGSPATGLVLYNSSTNYLQYYNGSSWVNASAAGGLAINDLSDATTDYVTDFNMFMGDGAGASIASGGQSNLIIGQDAGNGISTGDSNVVIGWEAAQYLTTHSGNVFMGNRSGYLAEGDNNVGIGDNALSGAVVGDIGSSNIGIGFRAGRLNSGTGENVFIGHAAGESTESSGNVAIGFEALQAQETTTSANTAVGYRALKGGGASSDNGNYNTAIGFDAGLAVTSGDNNTFVGHQAGDITTTGSNNIIIGYDLDPSSATASNELNIGDVIYASGLYGATTHLGISNSSPDVELDVTGDIEYTGTITDVSDRRLKADIQKFDADDVLRKLALIDTYSFKMKDDGDGRVEFGVMAQELEEIFPELVHTAKDEMGTKSVNYVGLIAPMIEASKKLKSENDALKAELALIKEQQGNILHEVKGLKAHTGFGVDKAQFRLIDVLLLFGLFGCMGYIIWLRRKATI